MSRRSYSRGCSITRKLWKRLHSHVQDKARQVGTQSDIRPTRFRYIRSARNKSPWHDVEADFVLQASNLPPLRQRYMTLKHTVNSLLFKQWGDGTMALLKTDEAQKIIGAHFSPQHQADSKGKQEGRETLYIGKVGKLFNLVVSLRKSSLHFLYDAELTHPPFLFASGWLINWHTLGL